MNRSPTWAPLRVRKSAFLRCRIAFLSARSQRLLLSGGLKSHEVRSGNRRPQPFGEIGREPEAGVVLGMPHAHNLRTDPVEEFWVFDELCVTGFFAAIGGATEFLGHVAQLQQRCLQGVAIAQSQ